MENDKIGKYINNSVNLFKIAKHEIKEINAFEFDNNESIEFSTLGEAELYSDLVVSIIMRFDSSSQDKNVNALISKLRSDYINLYLSKLKPWIVENCSKYPKYCCYLKYLEFMSLEVFSLKTT